MTFLVNVTAVLRTFPDEYMAWLKRELYSNSCGHASCNTCTLTLFVSNFEAMCASNTAHKVISLYGDLKTLYWLITPCAVSKQRMERLQRNYAYGVTQMSLDWADGTYKD
jgi:hypothetical protein